MEKFIGKWEAFEAENQEALFDVYTLPEAVREHMRNSPTIHYLRQEGDLWFMKMEIGGKGRDVKLKLGEEFEDIGPTGDTFKGTVTWDGSKFVGKARFEDKNIDSTIVRRMEGDIMIVEVTANGKNSTQKFKKVA